MARFKWLFLMLVCAAVAQTSVGQSCACDGTNGVTVTITPSNAGGATCCVNTTNGDWRDVAVTLNNPALGETVFVVIRAAGDFMLGRVTVNNTSNSEARLRILGTTDGSAVGGVGWISCVGSVSQVLLTELRTIEQVGYDRRTSANAIEYGWNQLEQSV